MIVKTYCARMDHGGCGILAHVENGKVVKIEGDPDSPLSRGTVCAKGLAQIERLHHPDRLRYPMKRVGAKGEGKWERIFWNEALKIITLKIKEIIDRDGRKAISFAQGTPKGLEIYLMIRLANLLNVPNICTPGHICHMPRETASNLTCGFFPIPDYDHSSACVAVWGSNLFQTNEEGILGAQLKRALDRGAKLMVIDPKRSSVASKADLWLQPRPGTDLALALGMLRIMIDEALYDQDFVTKWSNETKRGTIRQRAKLDPEIDPRVVIASFGWWFPERKDLELSGWKESNLNILTSNDPPYDPALGSTALRALPCRVYKSEGF